MLAADGELTQYGTARTIKYRWIPAEAIQTAGTKPASKTLNDNGYSVISFADNLEKEVQFNFKVPEDMDLSAASYLCVGWSSPATSETCDWDLTYLITALNDTTEAAGTNDQEDGTSSATANGLVQTSFTFAGATFTANDVCVHCKLMRDGDDANDTLGDIAELHGVMFKYYSNKLGEAT
jgi:hypothetical protein